jgi:uncharacterized protein YqjF (DUF2071 family)
MDLTALHWRVDPDVLAQRLPAGLDPDLFDGSAWVGLIPFHMRDIGFARGPGVPWLGTFPETNVRTYVVGKHGPGVWFDSLEASRLLPVVAARWTFGLPYMWSKMRIEGRDDGFRYTSRRRWGGPDASSDVDVTIGEATRSDDRDVFLSARWRLYSTWRGRLTHAPVDHEPWVLHEATATVSDELVAAAGYDVTGDPLVRFSPGVTVRIGRPHFVR